MLSDAADAFSLIERIIEREKHPMLLGEARPLRRRLDTEALRCAGEARRDAEPRRAIPAASWCRASASTRRWPATTIMAAWSSSARQAASRRSTTRGCSTRRGAGRSPSAARHRSQQIERNGTKWRLETGARHDRGRRGRHRDQRLYGRRDAAPQAPGHADRQPHHRDRGAVARSRRIAHPEGAHARPTRAACFAITACRPTASASSSAGGRASRR